MRFVGRRPSSRAAAASLRDRTARTNGRSSPSSSMRKLESPDNGNLDTTEQVSSSVPRSQLSPPPSWSFRLPHEDYELVSLEHVINKPFSFLTEPPSLEEVNEAVSSLTLELGKHERHVDGATCRQFCSASSEGGDVDWLEPSTTMFYPMSLQSSRANDVYEAFHMLQTDPTVQKMVLSLSSDPAVWKAVMNNDVVRDLRETYFTDEYRRKRSISVLSVLKYIFQGAKAKLVELYKNIAKLVEDVLKPPFNDRVHKGFDEFENMMKISFLLSILVLFVVMVTRYQSCC